MSPAPGVPNNPEGSNSWTGFADEPPYGEVTKQKALQDGAPLAVGKLTVGALNAPKRAQKQAGKQQPVDVRAAASEPMPTTFAQQLPPPNIWQQLAATPGSERWPLISYYASKAES